MLHTLHSHPICKRYMSRDLCNTIYFTFQWKVRIKTSPPLLGVDLALLPATWVRGSPSLSGQEHSRLPHHPLTTGTRPIYNLEHSGSHGPFISVQAHTEGQVPSPGDVLLLEVSADWRPNSEDSRKPYTGWLVSLLQRDTYTNTVGIWIPD